MSGAPVRVSVEECDTEMRRTRIAEYEELEIDAEVLDALRSEAIDYYPQALERLRQPWSLPNSGLFLHFLARGFVGSACLGVLYGTLQGVMAMPGHVYATAQTTVLLPVALKVIFGFLSDGYPIAGSRRRSYAIIGWTVATLALLLVAVVFREPAPYYCSDGTTYDQTAVCNPRAQESAHLLVLMLTMVTLGLVVADAAAEGLVIEICQAQLGPSPADLQIWAMMIECAGSAAAYVFLATCFNGPQHLGYFGWELGLTDVLRAMTMVAAVTLMGWVVAVSSDLPAPPVPCCGHTRVTAAKCVLLVDLFSSRRFALFVVYNLLVPTLLAMTPPVEGMIWNYWVHVQNLQAQFTELGNALATALALECVRRWFLNTGWHDLVTWTTLLSCAVSAPVIMLTALGVVRNQYFFLCQELVENVPRNVVYLVGRMACAHMAPRGQEATVVGLVASIQAVATPLGRGLSNSMYALLPVLLANGDWAKRGSLSDARAYVADTAFQRCSVAVAYTVMYCLVFLSLFCLVWVPSDRFTAYRTQCAADYKISTGLATAALVAGSFVVGLLLGVGAVVPGLSCMEAFGGAGCY